MYKKPEIKKVVDLDILLKEKVILTDAWGKSWGKSWNKTGGWNKNYQAYAYA